MNKAKIKLHSNSWTVEEDKFASNFISKKIKENNMTRQEIFEAASEELLKVFNVSRTPGACQLRFNSVLKKLYSCEVPNKKIKWEPEEDQLVLDTVKKYIDQGKTRLDAFAEISEKINRTVDAVGFRYNKVLKNKKDENQNISQINNKIDDNVQEKEVSSIQNIESIQTDMVQGQTFEQLITNITELFNKEKQENKVVKEENKFLKEENKTLKEENVILKQKVQSINDTFARLKELKF